ncbi:MAG: aspartyl protease family protein [Flavobacteriaceae bacterium]
MKLVLKRITLFILLIFLSFNILGQNKFNFYGPNQDKQDVRFRLINNLIVFPIEINGKQLSFILDTGVNKTILFSLLQSDSLDLRNVEKAALKGLGEGRPVEALLSRNNTFRIKNLISNNETLYVILEDKFDLSSKMGVTIHGIIGFNMFKDVIIKIDYRNKRLTFYNPKKYKQERCKKCVTFPLIFHNNKPYIRGKVATLEDPDSLVDVKLLIDSGGSDALWLFEGSHEKIKTPTKFFNDVLGEGLSGTIYGKRSRISKFILGPYHIEKPTVSYLDTISSFNARKFKGRNGSLGGNILKRFKVWIDYPNQKITLKKAGSFTTGFNYNMSGITLTYSGKELVKEAQNTEMSVYDRANQSGSKSVSFITSYRYFFRNTYMISGIAEGSPADLAGLKVGDIFLAINNKNAHEFNLQDIINLFQERDGKRIFLRMKRNGTYMKFKFRLRKEI